jgi:hypothetical protein
MLNMAKPKNISSRELRHGTPEEVLSPGESLTIRKRNGKVFELRRVDPGQKSILKHLDELLREIPNPGKRVRTKVSSIVVEERE